MSKSGLYREMADRLNAVKPGMALRISRNELADLPSLPDWAFMANITMGFDRVKESVVGSGRPDVWQFRNEPNGDITAYRLPEPPQEQRREQNVERIMHSFPTRLTR